VCEEKKGNKKKIHEKTGGKKEKAGVHEDKPDKRKNGEGGKKKGEILIKGNGNGHGQSIKRHAIKRKKNTNREYGEQLAREMIYIGGGEQRSGGQRMERRGGEGESTGKKQGRISRRGAERPRRGDEVGDQSRAIEDGPRQKKKKGLGTRGTDNESPGKNKHRTGQWT